MKSGDISTKFITELPNGYMLWRCENDADILYSYITDSNGFEEMSNTTDNEADMLRVFYEYRLGQQSDENLIKSVRSVFGKDIELKADSNNQEEKD